MVGRGPMSTGGLVRLPGKSNAVIEIWLSLRELRLNSRARERAEEAGAEDFMVVERTVSMILRVAGGKGHSMNGQRCSSDLPLEKE